MHQICDRKMKSNVSLINKQLFIDAHVHKQSLKPCIYKHEEVTWEGRVLHGRWHSILGHEVQNREVNNEIFKLLHKWWVKKLE